MSFGAISLVSRKERTATIRIFAAASFLNDFGSDMIYPVWPLFVTAILNANMSILGMIDGLGDAIVSISQAVSGYIADKTRKRKIFVWTGYLFGAFSRIGYAFSAAWIHLVPFRILDRAGKMRGAPRDAIIADLSTRENRGKNFGLLRAMDNLGAVVGILVCVFSLSIYGLTQYVSLFLIAAIPSLIGALLILVVVKESKPSGARLYRSFSFKDLNWNFKLFLVLSAFFSLGSFSYSFLLIYAQKFGFQPAFLPVLYLVFTATASLLSLPFGRLSDAIGRKAVMMISFGFWGMTCASIILAHNYWIMGLSFILYGLHKGAIEPVQRAFVAELAPTQYRASSLGGFQLVIGLCALPSSMIAGLLWDGMNAYAPFYFSMALTTLSIVLLAFVKEKHAAI